MQKVTKNQFIQVLHRYTESSLDEAQKILALKEDFPYSQVLHALAARLCKDHRLPSHQQELQMAAVYAADRTVLKEIMTRMPETWPTSNEVAGIRHPDTPESIATHRDHGNPVEDVDVAEELIHDLHRLNELRHNFEMMFIDTEDPHIRHDPPADVDTSTAAVAEKPDRAEENHKEPAPAAEKPKTPAKRKSRKSKAQRIVELAKKLQAEDPAPEPLTEADKKKDEGGADIIQEIKSSKKKIKPETEKQREQLEIINEFIRTQPNIANARDKHPAVVQGDLTTIKSGEFGDNVISETLVEILVKQGKKDRAIEVLKKLIWKFPQKKGYFASQIEELKK